MISVNDISKVVDKRNRIKKETYVKLYEQVTRKIKRAVEIKQLYVDFEVPMMVLGYPTYDRIKATSYVKRQLELGEFNVVIIGEFLLRITWKIKKQIHDGKSEDDTTEFPTLVNLKKYANKYRGFAGKG